MLYFPLTKAYTSQEFPVAPGAAILAEGCALVAVNGTDASFGLAPSTGVAGEIFAGVSLSQQIELTERTFVETFIASSSTPTELQFAPITGEISYWDNDTNAPATSPTLLGKKITWNVAQNGHSVTVRYTHALTVNQARTLQGDVIPGGPAGATLRQIGAIKNGTVFTDQFDPKVNWSAPDPVVTLGADGKFTIGGYGTEVKAIVVQIPTAGVPFLGLNLQY